MLTEDQKLSLRKKLFVRRQYKRYPVLALLFIRERYPDYTEDQLLKDIIVKRRPKKRNKKKKAILDFRRVQMEKYAQRLKQFDKDSREYNQACNMIAILENAHQLKTPIELNVKLNGEKMTYYFHWDTKERRIKEFVAAANTKGTTHEMLEKLLRPSFTGN